MDTSKQIFEKERREKKAQEVKIQFIDELLEDINVLDEEGSVKYYGHISKDTLKDDCSCPSFHYGMRYDKVTAENLKGESNYFKEHGINFQCKHILRAKEVRGWQE